MLSQCEIGLGHEDQGEHLPLEISGCMELDDGALSIRKRLVEVTGLIPGGPRFQRFSRRRLSWRESRYR